MLGKIQKSEKMPLDILKAFEENAYLSKSLKTQVEANRANQTPTSQSPPPLPRICGINNLRFYYVTLSLCKAGQISVKVIYHELPA